MKEKAILLLPGGGMSSWVWEKLIPYLDLDSDIVCPEYRIKENTVENRESVTIQDCVSYLISLVDSYKLVIVVGHSGAGILAASLAKRIPDKVMGILYISANIPHNHTSTIDHMPILLKYINSKAIKSQVKKKKTPMSTKAFMVIKSFAIRRMRIL
jgi:pimeloyl-ACP methyl ester carboxylesterase